MEFFNEIGFDYEIFRVEFNITPPEFLEDLENYVLDVELSKRNHFTDQCQRLRQKLSLEFYDMMVCQYWTSFSLNLVTFNAIFNESIFEYDNHKNEPLLICGLRLLFTIPKYFLVLEHDQFENLVDKLISLSITTEEPTATHSIKCLQIVAYLCLNKHRKYNKFGLIFKIIVNRLLTFIEIGSDDILIPISQINYTQKYENCVDVNEMLNIASKNFEQLNVPKFDLFTYMDVGPIFSAYSQKFHYMALLNYMVPLLNPSELYETDVFIELLYLCLNVEKCKSDSLCSLAISIAIKCINDKEFVDFFVDNSGILRFCSVPFYLFSVSQVASFLAHMSQNSNIMCHISKNPDWSLLMINYAINCYPSSETDDSCIFLINSFKYSQYHCFFDKIGGIQKLFDRVKLMPIFLKLKNEPNIDDLNDTSDLINFFAKNFIKLLFYHLLIKFKSLMAPDEARQMPPFNPDCINYHTCDKMLKYFEKNFSLKSNVEFIEEFLQPEAIETLLLIFISEKKLVEKNNEIYRQFLYIMKFLSLHHSSLTAFMIPLKFYPKTKIVTCNLIYYFKYQLENYLDRKDIFEINPFYVYKNLLISCFSSIVAYKDFLKQRFQDFKFDFEQSDEYFFIFIDENAKSFIQNLIANNIIAHVIEFVLIDDSSQFNISAKISAIKLLFLLTISKRVLQILSKMRNFFEHNIIPILMGMYFNGKAEHETGKFVKYLCRIVCRINTYFGKSSIIAPYVQPIKKFDDEYNAEFARNAINYFEKNVGRATKNFHIKSQKEDNNKESEFETCGSLERFGYFSSSFHNSVRIVEEFQYRGRSRHKMRINRYGSMYKNSNFTKFYSEEKSARCAKILIDDKIIVSTPLKVCLYKNNTRECDFKPYCTSINHLNDSEDGQFIIGSGGDWVNLEKGTKIWKYGGVVTMEPQLPIEMISNLHYSKFTRENHIIFGLTCDLDVNMYDLNKKIKIMEFKNDFPIYYRYTSIEMNQNNNLLLFNGDLFCTRSGKLVYSFTPFNVDVSGIFMPSDMDVIIHTQHWDLRTFRLFEIKDYLEGIHLQRPFNSDIVIGREIIDDSKFQTSLKTVDFFDSSLQRFQKTIKIYESRNLTLLKNFQMDNEFNHCDVSRDGSKILISNCCKNDNKNYEILTLIDIQKDSASQLKHTDRRCYLT